MGQGTWGLFSPLSEFKTIFLCLYICHRNIMQRFHNQHFVKQPAELTVSCSWHVTKKNRMLCKDIFLIKCTYVHPIPYSIFALTTLEIKWIYEHFNYVYHHLIFTFSFSQVSRYPLLGLLINQYSCPRQWGATGSFNSRNVKKLTQVARIFKWNTL